MDDVGVFPIQETAMLMSVLCILQLSLNHTKASKFRGLAGGMVWL